MISPIKSLFSPRHIILATALLLAGFSGVQQAQAQINIGFSVGYNYNRLTDIDLGPGQSSFENATGWHMELWFDMAVANLALRPGLRYMSAGPIFEFMNNDNPNLNDRFNVNLFEIPIDFRFRFNMQIATPYITIGPVLRFPSGAKGEVGGLRNASIAGGLGVGLELNFIIVRIYPELKYNFGITRFTEKNFQINNIPFTTTDTQLLNGVLLRIGVGI